MFIVCLFISIFIWILVRLSKDYIYTVDYHLTYTHVPDGHRLTGASDTVVKVNLKLQGFDFFSEQYFRNKRRFHEVNLRNARLKYYDNHLAAYLLSMALSREISAGNNYPMEIYSISPDTLFFSFERKIPKRTPLTKINPLPANKVHVKADSIKPSKDSLLNKRGKQTQSITKKVK